ncbi:MAG: calcium-binding protein [Microcoleaceae cyanobacterium]
MVFVVNDSGSLFVNFGGFNPPTTEQVTGGINARPIVDNPLAGVEIRFEVDLDPAEISDLNPGDDVLLGTASNDVLEGGGGNDLLQGLQGDDQMVGGSGDDTLLGGQQNDNLIGGSGNDVLSGDRGQDTLSGETGRDIFILATASATFNPDQADVITDFIVGTDQIGLTDGLTAAQLQLVSTFQFGQPGTLVVNGLYNTALGFISNVGVNDVWGSFLSVS